MAAPSHYDTTQPIDIKYSKIEAKNQMMKKLIEEARNNQQADTEEPNADTEEANTISSISSIRIDVPFQVCIKIQDQALFFKK